MERTIAAAPTPTPATVGQSVPVTGIGLGVPAIVGAGVAEEVGVGVAAPQLQSVAEAQSGFRQDPPEQISPEAQLLSLPQLPLQVFGEAVGVGDAVGDGDAVGVAAKLLHTVKSVVQAAPAAGQQYCVWAAPQVATYPAELQIWSLTVPSASGGWQSQRWVASLAYGQASAPGQTLLTAAFS